MAKLPLFSPLRGIRPAPGKAQEVVAPPYDVLDCEEARELAAGKPWSFLHVSKAEIDFPRGADPYSDAVYQKAADNFRSMLDAGVIVREKKPCFYIYGLKMGDHVQTGLVVGACIEDYDANRIRKHEFTRPVKEEDRAKQIRFVQAQTGPALIAYKQMPQVDAIIKNKVKSAPAFSVEGIGGVIHTLWVVDEQTDIGIIVESFEKQEAVYIADGHHRAAAASKVRKHMMAQRGASHVGTEPYNYFLAVGYPVNEMRIWDYNRVVKDLNGLSPRIFLEKLRENFEIRRVRGQAKPAARREFGLYLEGEWHLMRPACATPAPSVDPVMSLDVSVLSDLVLERILDIKDLRTSERVDFVGGIRGLDELERRVDSGQMKAAFALYPPSLDDLIAVSDAGRVMPPKSTWFEPKLADGLVSNPLL